MSADLVAFMRARLAEDEQDAQCAIVQGLDGRYDGEVWSVVDREVRTDDGSRSGVAIARTRHDDPGAAAHIARWDPARVLAEVAAKRAILDRCAAVIEDRINYAYEARVLAEDVLRLLVQPHAEHPHFHPSWATA